MGASSQTNPALKMSKQEREALVQKVLDGKSGQTLARKEGKLAKVTGEMKARLLS